MPKEQPIRREDLCDVAAGEASGMSNTASGPSDAAVRVAMHAVAPNPGFRDGNGVWHVGHTVADERRAREILTAAHDPANFEDAHDVSVRLGDVMETLRGYGVSEILLRTFGGDRA